jgi:hypothetical protein
VQVLTFLLVLCFFVPSSASGNYLSQAGQLSGAGVNFTWFEVEAKSLRVLLEYQEGESNWKQVNLGSGFLISSDGLFVTAYHVVQYCLLNQKKLSRFSESTDCSTTHPQVRYKAQNLHREFDIEIISHLREEDSTGGKSLHTPDEIIKQRDFVIGKLKTQPGTHFDHWQLPDFQQGIISRTNPRADFELRPLLPPKRVFIAGYPEGRDLAIAHGFLNLMDENHRGYFAADYKLYGAAYLERQGIPPDTRWGIRVENHMSGGAVIDAAGSLVGVVVNGNINTAGILSIENVLETFFSRNATAGAAPSIFLTPTKTPLYLREHSADQPAEE